MTVPERIAALRGLMKERKIDAYLIPSGDFHQSEYAGAYFQARAYMTGFTGSAGTALVTQTEAGLWTDGRYFIQAEKQLAGSGIRLFRAGEPDVPSIQDYLKEALPYGGTLGFDGKILSAGQGEMFKKALSPKPIQIACGEDLVNLIWDNRPPLSAAPAFLLSEKYTGESAAAKLVRVREIMQKEGADIHLVASLDDICWITNLRGGDIAYCPLLLSYAVITPTDMFLYTEKEKLSEEILAALEKDHIFVRPYQAIYDDVRKFPSGSSVLLDPDQINYTLRNQIPRNIPVICRQNPARLLKAVKNETELANIRRAHIKDGIAVTRFMYWLKMHAGKIPLTERDVSKKLESFRSEQPGYLGPSFAPISAFGSHAAIVHYSASPETDRTLSAGGLLLMDTGGHYLEGSTDITRTFALGSVPEEQKRDFTTVLRGNLRLAQAVFPSGTTGYNLDVLARQPLWERGLDFRHGAGHGVGYLLNIHESPANFRRTAVTDESNVLRPGMVITNEPGLYVEDSHGIRIENEMIVQKGPKTEYGQFLHFEPVTCAPIDLDAVLPSQMSAGDRACLNAYHSHVYKTLAPCLCSEERQWLKTYTRKI